MSHYDMISEDRATNRMAMSAKRIAYAGPFHDSDRLLGGYAIFVSPRQPFAVFFDGRWTGEGHVFVVPPYTRHYFSRPMIMQAVLIEAESVAPDFMDDLGLFDDERRTRYWVDRIGQGFENWGPALADADEATIDRHFFGGDLCRGRIDERVAFAIDRVSQSPDGDDSMPGQIARRLGLSESRLRHLFREQIGVSFRSFRAWKRLRNSIGVAIEEPNILNVAMAAGYADASHYSHSMMQYMGYQPKHVCAHWRNLQIFGPSDGAPAGLHHPD